MPRVRRDHLAEVEAWRAARLARLRSPEGWLAVVGLVWLREGDNPIALPRDTRPGVGSIEVRQGCATFRPAPDVATTNGGELVEAPIELRDDVGGEPTVLRVGSLSFYVIRRLGELAVRVKDDHAPAIAAFRGIEYYPVQERWRVECRFEPYEPAREAQVPTVLEAPETYQVPGALAFEIDGRTYRLDAFLEEGERDLFVVFGDLTNATETFGGGRYLYTPQAGSDGVVNLDLNLAYNPPCVFTPHATCPLPLPQNRLPIRVEAGEKRYRG